jgi:hypothetical protein
MRKTWIVPLVVAICIFPGVPKTSATDNTLSNMTVSLVSPTSGTTINPDVPFTITLDLLGGPASSANSCEDPSLTGFQFGAQEFDSNNVGQALDLITLGGTHYSTGTALWGWTPKIITGGIECSLLIEHNERARLSASWVPAWDNTWFGNSQNGQFGTPTRVDIAWDIGAGVEHHVFQATSVGSPSLSIKGLARGQVVNYSTSFQVVATLSDALPFQGIGVSMEAPTLHSTEEQTLFCGVYNPKSQTWDTEAQKTGDTNGIVTYTEQCEVILPGGDATIATPSFAINTSIYTINTFTEVAGPSVIANVGKQGRPIIEMVTRNKSGEPDGIYSSLDTKNPWSTPASLKLEGVACMTSKSDCSSSQLDPISNFPLQICVNSKCSTSTTNAAGAFSFSQIFTSKTVNWSITGFYQEEPIEDANLFYVQLGSHNNDPINQGPSGSLQLPIQPPTPLNAAQQKANNQAYYEYGVKIMSSFTSSYLVQIGFLKFFLPGHKALTNAYAQDFCRQLPGVVPGLRNQIGSIPDTNFVNGCASVALKIKLK